MAAFRVFVITTFAMFAASVALGQVTRADYERSQGLSEKYRYLTVDVPEPATWIEKSQRFYYRKSVKGGHEFVTIDAATLERRPSVDHQRLADALCRKPPTRRTTALRLPFSHFSFTDGERAIEFTVQQRRYRCELADYSCRRAGPPPGSPFARGLGGPFATARR